MKDFKGSFPNIPFPTLGGQQLWLDRFFFAGWRIQKNILTKHHRLLSGGDIRKAWGSFEACKKALFMEKERGKIQNPSETLVLLVHGMAGFPQTFYRLERGLKKRGFFVDGYNYPSLSGTLEDQAVDLNTLLNSLEGIKHLTLIGHSQGGAIIRKALETKADWRESIDLDGIVLVGTPNRGAALADFSKRLKAINAIAPKVRDQLTKDYASRMKKPEVRTGLIAGSMRNGRGINPYVPGDDDGIVGVEEVWIEGIEDRLIVKSDHFSLTNRKASRDAIFRFLDGKPLAG